MPITFNNNIFHLYNSKMSYCIKLSKFNDLMHIYWGKRIDFKDLEFQYMERTSPTVYEDTLNSDYSLEAIPLEYPFYGTSDLREPAIIVELSDGSSVIEPRYISHKIYNEKPRIFGLPAIYTNTDNEAVTLEILLKDKKVGLELILYYTVFENSNVICRNVKILNNSNQDVYLKKVSSVSMDFLSDNYKYMHLYGAHIKEKQVEYCDIHKGVQGFESRRGLSGHYENPFMAIMDKTATEDSGNVFGFALLYSGNHSFKIESDNHELMRIQAGINSFSFKWKLEPTESFSSPEAVMVYSADGLGEMSRTYHKIFRKNLCRGYWRDKVRPILFNSWEAAFFDFDEDKLLEFAANGKKAGLELFVLDDGWFGERNDDTTSLGDWTVNKKKIPSGIDGLSKKIKQMGMKFGLWFEPEMISFDSELYKSHPDWLIQIPGKTPHPARNQYVLDLSRKEVCEFIVKSVGNIIETADLDYIKWDMNRAMSDVYSKILPTDRQGEVMHRYILGLYSVLETLTQAYPKVLFENCASGGGRYDAGMLHYMPQTWTSDNTEALDRIHIQYGNSMIYPASSMGAHIGNSRRYTPLEFRGTVAMAGVFGYEFDMNNLSDDEFKVICEQVQFYKEIRDIVTFGKFYRLLQTDEETYSAWMYVSEDKERAVVSVVSKVVNPNESRKRIYLKGLEEDCMYEFDNSVHYGSELMNFGVEYINDKDFNAVIFVVNKTDNIVDIG